MGEKRKPYRVLLLKKEGKTHKIEFFRAYDFGVYYKQYRVRTNGIWWPEGKKEFFYQSELRNIVWKTIGL